MAADLASSEHSGLTVQLCGDAHLSNFGGYASAERQLVFDINDFHETFPGPFEWDVKRLAASVVVAGQANGFSAEQCRVASWQSAHSYRRAMRRFARQPMLDVWYAHLNIEAVARTYAESLGPKARRKHADDLESVEATLAKAQRRDRLQAVGKLTEIVDGHRQIKSDPPLMVRLADFAEADETTVSALVEQLLGSYLASTTDDIRHLVSRYSITDIAHKVVGVGSVGARAWVLLLETGNPVDSLLLQAKQAQVSVLAPYLPDPGYPNQGERVVQGQRLMQASSDIFLGWLGRVDTRGIIRDFYLRQLRDWKISADVGAMSPEALRTYARLCGWTLARAHARSGDRIAIAAYLGKKETFEDAVADFAVTYTAMNTADHAALRAAIDAGDVEAQEGL